MAYDHQDIVTRFKWWFGSLGEYWVLILFVIHLIRKLEDARGAGMRDDE